MIIHFLKGWFHSKNFYIFFKNLFELLNLHFCSQHTSSFVFISFCSCFIYFIYSINLSCFYFASFCYSLNAYYLSFFFLLRVGFIEITFYLERCVPLTLNVLVYLSLYLSDCLTLNISGIIFKFYKKYITP